MCGSDYVCGVHIGQNYANEIIYPLCHYRDSSEIEHLLVWNFLLFFIIHRVITYWFLVCRI
jgi:hypothetical protein